MQIPKKKLTRIFALPGLKNNLLRHSVSVDDLGYTFTICTAISHGREGQGERAYCQVCGQQEGNLTIYDHGNM